LFLDRFVSKGGVVALWPLAVYFAAVLTIVMVMIGLSYVLGQRHEERATGQPYESGVVSTGSAQVRLSVQFYLVAMLFVIFDLEVVFIFAWAIAGRELGWTGFIVVLIFVVLMVDALAYLWRQGALDWGVSERTRTGKGPGGGLR
jgi:NADH-quinone oxidoreductase subunit A